MIIYLITNKINGKCYIGQTRQKLSVRFRQHGYSYSNCSLVNKAIHKYGKENFTIIPLFETTCQITLNSKEREFIKEYKSFGEGYNLTSGGENAYVRSEETRRKLSLASKGKGRPHTPETKARLSEMKKGNKNPMFGRSLSQEHRKAIANSLKGKKRPAEVVAKIKANHNSKSDLNLTYRRHNT